MRASTFEIHNQKQNQKKKKEKEKEKVTEPLKIMVEETLREEEALRPGEDESRLLGKASIGRYKQSLLMRMPFDYRRAQRRSIGAHLLGAPFLWFLLLLVTKVTFSEQDVTPLSRRAERAREVSDDDPSPAPLSLVGMHSQVFYKSSLPFGREITVYMLSGEVKRLIYHVEGMTTPLTLTVTPCIDPIHWSLYYVDRLKTKEPRVRHRNGRRRRRRRRRFQLQEKYQRNTKSVLLASYYGNQRRIFSDVQRTSGAYVLELNTQGLDSRAKLLLSQYYPYPLLPEDDTVSLVMGDSQNLIEWNTSPSASIGPIEYCVSLSRKGPLVSFCQIEEEEEEAKEGVGVGENSLKDGTRGESRDNEALSPFAEWWEKTMKGLLAESREEREKSPFLLNCASSQTWHQLKAVEPMTTYFVDVFARNSVTNATSVYKGLNFTSPPAPVHPIKLKDNAMTVIHLSESNDFSQMLKYSYTESDLHWLEAGLWLFFETCPDPSPSTNPGPLRLSVRIGHNNKGLDFKRDLNSMGSEVIFIPINISSSSSPFQPSETRKIVLEISSKQPLERRGALLVNKKYNGFPFPRMPSDRSIKLFTTLTTCDSVTLSWAASSDSKVRYCIFERELDKQIISYEMDGSSLFPEKQYCQEITASSITDGNRSDLSPSPSPRPPSNMSDRKVLCRRYHKFSKRRFNDIIMQRVKGLKPSTEYVFQVRVSKRPATGPLSYESIRVITKPESLC